MLRKGRPRKPGERNARGKLRPLRRSEQDVDWVRAKRQIAFGLTARQAKDPLSCCLAGALYLRQQITRDHLLRFFSFLQLAPNLGPRAIVVCERVQFFGTSTGFPHLSNKMYRMMIREMGRESMNVLHELAEDRLICGIRALRATLARVPLTTVAFEYKFCDIQCGKLGSDAKTKKEQASASPLVHSPEVETSR
jgi:hypothetical protein